MIKIKNFIKMFVIVFFLILNDFYLNYNCLDNNMCNFNTCVQGIEINDGNYKFELNNIVYTTELGFGLITIGNTSFKCELILVYNEKYNNDYGLTPMLHDIDNFIFDDLKSKDTVFYILNMNESISETCPGYLIKNDIKYEFYLIIRYTDDVVNKLKELQIYPFIPHLKSVNHYLNLSNPHVSLMNLEMSNLLESNYLIESNLIKVNKSRGKQRNFGIFLLTTEEYKCGHILIIKNKTDDWLREKDFLFAKKNLIAQLNKNKTDALDKTDALNKNKTDALDKKIVRAKYRSSIYSNSSNSP